MGSGQPSRSGLPPLTAAGASSSRPVPGVLKAAAIASLGAGAIHATAAGAHSEHPAAVRAFVLIAVAQLGWGAWALGRTGRLLGLAGAAINAAAFGGWLLAKTSGIVFIAGLDTRESVQYADALAATLATVAVAGALAALADGLAPGLSARRASDPRAGGASDPRAPSSSGARARHALIGVAAIATVALVVPGMAATANHSHVGGHDHDTVPVAVPYLATLPVDLGGVPGVSAEEVAEAEALVTASLQTLPRFADIPTILALGYRTIGDAETGFEHFVNWELVSDGRVLDPNYPESLVFAVDPTTGEKTLSAAMFMANAGDTLDTVPDVGGALVQWHVHNDLCYQGEPYAWRVAGVAEPGQECPRGTFRLGEGSLPMVHVWIVPHECGPFAALEGNGAGQIRPGEARLCDHAHGAPS